MDLTMLNKILWFARVIVLLLNELIALLDPEQPDHNQPPDIALHHDNKNLTTIDPRGHAITRKHPCRQSRQFTSRDDQGHLIL